MSKRLNIKNQRFGKLVALSHSHDNASRQAVWKCVCDCGNITYAPAFKLANGKITSCDNCKPKRICKTCGREFIPNNHKQIYCRDACKPRKKSVVKYSPEPTYYFEEPIEIEPPKYPMNVFLRAKDRYEEEHGTVSYGMFENMLQRGEITIDEKGTVTTLLA